MNIRAKCLSRVLILYYFITIFSEKYRILMRNIRKDNWGMACNYNLKITMRKVLLNGS